jgi:myosin V
MYIFICTAQKIEEVTLHMLVNIYILNSLSLLLPQRRTVEQLRYGGVLEAVHVARAGFPVRMAHQEFTARYAALAGIQLKKAATKHASLPSGKKQRMLAKTLLVAVVNPLGSHAVTSLERSKIIGSDSSTSTGGAEASSSSSSSSYTETQLNDMPEEEWKVILGDIGLQLGLTKVFFRQKAFDGIESLRAKAAGRAACTIQSIVRMLKSKWLYLEARQDIIIIQKLARGKKARKLTRERRHKFAAIKLQRVVRGRMAKKPFQAKKKVALCLQVTRKYYTHNFCYDIFFTVHCSFVHSHILYFLPFSLKHNSTCFKIYTDTFSHETS